MVKINDILQYRIFPFEKLKLLFSVMYDIININILHNTGNISEKME
jgi:hypothetical protein